jgi:hypothetical protein
MSEWVGAKRRGRIITCQCGKTSHNFGYGLCNRCYERKYRESHPEVMRKVNEKQNEKKRIRYMTDPEYRKKIYEREKEWLSNPENRKKKNEYYRKYRKIHPRVYMTRIGFVCWCGNIDKSRANNRPRNPHSMCQKCPKCGNYTEKKKVIYDRFTGEIVGEL